MPTVGVTALILVFSLSDACAAKANDPLGVVDVSSHFALPTASFETTDPFGLVAAPSYGATPTLTARVGAEDLSPRTYSVFCVSFALANL